MSDLKKAKAKVQANLERKERILASLGEAQVMAKHQTALKQLVNLVLLGSKKSLA